ncbi:MAG: ABC transporter permease [Saprospiraceae bacterium]|nr:ABC transporter permease [Saprospiraceae bacterium]MCB9328875.1 ABC transporter permease [Lewinellaceae bacterium]HPK08832.1 ABC transporter permease [Saprospiraceae bacterium]
MIKDALEHFGKFVAWQPQIYKKPENRSMYQKEIIRQMYDIGIGSLGIVFLISVFIGAVTSVQFYYQMEGTLIPPYYIGYVVRDMTIIELAPTITCLVLAGKVGSNMAAEIGGMRQKEHIDAMEIMGVNTSAYLVMPKTVAAVLVIPILVCVAAILSLLGAYVASVPTGLFTAAEYTRGVRSFFIPYNVFMMLVKAVVFAYILTSVSCYQGYFVKGGSIELGAASTRAVVFSDILILLSDYIIAVLLTA